LPLTKRAASEAGSCRACSPPAISISAIISARSATSSRLQNDYETIYCVVDHARDHRVAGARRPQAQTYEIAAAYLAAGLDRLRSDHLQPEPWCPNTPQLELDLQLRGAHGLDERA
jgi:hypothetical protein